MSYEIPRVLKYDEKIILGLTFRQLIFVSVTTMVGLVIFKLITPLLVRVLLIAPVVVLGTGCAFLNLDVLMWNVFSFHSRPRKLGYLDARMSKFVGVESVDNDMVKLDSGELRAVLQATPVNFSLKTNNEQVAIIKCFQNFLNSLDFPVQITVRTVNMDLSNYLEYLKQSVSKKVEKRGNKPLERMFKDYCAFVETHVEKNAVKNRLFYLVISGDSPEELEIRVQLCMDGLANTGIVSRRLHSNQLMSLLASFYEGFVEVENNYLFPVTMFSQKASQEVDDEPL